MNLRSLAAREPRNAIEAAREKPLMLSPLAYVTVNLPAIKKLGVNVLCLMPPYPMGIDHRKGIGSPYSIRDFRAVDPEYGTLNELAGFIRCAHKLHLQVLLDITPNHTSRDHAWIVWRPEYYVKNAQGGIFYDGDWSDTAKLDYTNPALRQEMTEVYNHWLSFLGPNEISPSDGVDGFRLDMAHLINDQSFWNEAIPKLRSLHQDRELLFLAEGDGIQNNVDLFSRGINAAYDDDFYKVCQFLYAVTESGRSVIMPSPDTQTNAEFLDKYEAFKTGGVAAAMETALLNYESTLPPGDDAPRLARYTDNHDEGRGAYRFGEGATRAVNQLIFLSNHCLPFLLTGEEFGAVNQPSIHGRMRLCNKGRRLLHDGKVRIEDGIEFEGNLFARSAENRAGWHIFFKDLILLRLKTKELTRGKFMMIDAGENCEKTERTIVAFERRFRRSAVRCAVNLGPETRELKNTALFAGEVLYGGLQGNSLPPFSSLVVRVVN